MESSGARRRAGQRNTRAPGFMRVQLDGEAPGETGGGHGAKSAVRISAGLIVFVRGPRLFFFSSERSLVRWLLTGAGCKVRGS